MPKLTHAKFVLVAGLLCGMMLTTVSSAQPEERPEPRAQGQGDRRPQRRGDRGARRPGRDGGRDVRLRMGEQFMNRRMAEVMEQIKEGRAIPPEVEDMLERFGGRVLLRSPNMNAVDAAHYSVAEIHLRGGKHQECLKRLQKVIAEAGDEKNDTVWVTHLNCGNIYRHHIGNMQEAIREYKLVQGLWGGFAQRQLLRTYEEMDRLDEAVKLLTDELNAAAEPGAKLVLLRRIAELYERNDEPEKAIRYYDQITREFTRKQIAEMVKAAVDSVEKQVDRIVQLRREERFEEAERIVRAMHQRMAALRAQGRHAEADGMERARDAAHKRLEPREDDD